MSVSLTGWLLLASGALLVACGSGGSGPGPHPSATPSGTARGADAERTSVPASPTPASTATAAGAEHKRLVELTRSGGLKGDTLTLVVYDDATAELYDGTPAEGKLRSSTAVEPSQMAALRKALKGDWQTGKRLARQNPDAFTYEVRTPTGKATTSDGAARGPALEGLLKALSPIMRDAEVGR